MGLTPLRARILASIATSSVLAACGGETTTGTSSSGSGTTSGSSGDTTPPACRSRLQRSCFKPASTPTKATVGGGRVVDPNGAPPPPTPPPTRDANTCVIREEVANGCCDPAISGPEFTNGECCYSFCESGCCGRPLVVDGSARIAPRAARADWGTAAAAAALDTNTRTALHESFARDALLEHASIASFATFTLELLAVGAPPDLIVLAQAACGDEIEHARLTFAIANTYADAPIGPGALDLRGVAPSTSLAAIAAACVRDGCINETLASAIAAEQAKNASDPALRATLERIAEDEARHAELAWKFVRWALASGDVDVARAVDEAFAAPVALDPQPMTANVDATTWQAHGRLLPAEHRALVRAVVEQVIGPCRASLLG